MVLPGQYFDAETGLVHNGFRDYESASGRYIQSDPIGLAGDISTYAYVASNPLGSIDFHGLLPAAVPVPVPWMPPPAPPIVSVPGGVAANSAIYECVGISGASIASAIVAVGGIVWPNSTSGCDQPNPPPQNNCPGQDCSEILAQIEAQKQLVIDRYFGMLYDYRNLYENALITPLSRRGGTWVGHQQAFQNAQRNLMKLIDQAKAMNCPIDPYAVVWATVPPPDKPAGR